MPHFRIALAVTTLSGRVLPRRVIRVRAETRAEAETIARAVCSILERGPVRPPATEITPAPAFRVGDISLEAAVILAMTDWSKEEE